MLGPAFPGALGFLAPRLFSLGLIAAAFTTLISVSLTMTYFCLDMARRDWHFTDDNRLFKVVFALWIAVPALVAPFWQLPALLKAILAMVGNLLLAPVAVAVIFYFVNRPAMGEFRANAGRNLVLAVTLALRARPRRQRAAGAAAMSRAATPRREVVARDRGPASSPSSACPTRRGRERGRRAGRRRRDRASRSR